MFPIFLHVDEVVHDQTADQELCVDYHRPPDSPAEPTSPRAENQPLFSVESISYGCSFINENFQYQPEIITPGSPSVLETNVDDEQTASTPRSRYWFRYILSLHELYF